MTEKKTQAMDLLQGILDETASEASAEQERLEAELKQREEEERRKKAEAEQQRQAELQRQLAEEAERAAQEESRRKAAMEALRIQELKDKGLYTEPEPEKKPEPKRPSGPNTQQVVAQQKKSSLGGRLAAAAVVLLLGGGAAAYFVFGQVELVDAETRYRVSTPTTLALQGDANTIGFREIPDPIVVESEPEAAPTRRATRSNTRRNSASNTNSRPPRIQLGGSLRDE